MKFDTAILLIKILIFTLVGGLVPMGTALQQWINDGTWPPLINWVGIWIGFGIGAGNAFISFSSDAMSDWKLARGGANDTKMFVRNKSENTKQPSS